jgi:hypothetical protein
MCSQELRPLDHRGGLTKLIATWCHPWFQLDWARLHFAWATQQCLENGLGAMDQCNPPPPQNQTPDPSRPSLWGGLKFVVYVYNMQTTEPLKECVQQESANRVQVNRTQSPKVKMSSF